MADQSFDIEILDLYWVNQPDDPTDLCAHGHIYIQIGKAVADEKREWTLSAAVLNLMRTFDSDYKPGDFAGQLIPCCGFNMYVKTKGIGVDICGCCEGLDWEIIHEGNTVHHILYNGEVGTIDFTEYKIRVLQLANKVEQFYKESKPKQIPADKEDREGYLAFWKEWNTIRSKWG